MPLACVSAFLLYRIAHALNARFTIGPDDGLPTLRAHEAENTEERDQWHETVEQSLNNLVDFFA